MAIINSNRKPVRACFSYAAYSKNLINYLRSFDIPIEPGLTDAEFSDIESNLNFTFPPDLRSVLQEGLPVGPGFPNWRSTSTEQLQILINLPVINLYREISRNRFWLNSWGERPADSDRAVDLSKGFLENVPILVPVYRNFYIPAAPLLAGNPLFYVRGGDVSLWSFDIAGFFHQVELKAGEDVLRRPTLSELLSVPPWAATEARRIKFWSDLAAETGEGESGSSGGGWWSDECFGGRLENALWSLRNAGWKEEDVREMMIMDDDDGGSALSELDRGFVLRHVEILSKQLLRGGWSPEDVKESMGYCAISDDLPGGDDDKDDVQEESWYDCRQSNFSNWDGDDVKKEETVMIMMMNTQSEVQIRQK